MTQMDAVFRDLEAGLFLQTRMKSGSTNPPVVETELPIGLLTVTLEGRQFQPTQALIGRDFVAWADAHGLVIVPGRHASIRVEKSRSVQVELGPSFVIQHKLKFAKYLRSLTGNHLQLETMPSSPNITGSLVDVRGKFALIDLGAAIVFVELSRIKRIGLPVNNFSESVDEGLR